MSVDGFIAGEQDDLSFLSIVEKDGEDYGYYTFVDSIDTVLIGRKTYAWVCAQGIIPHQDKTVYVITHNTALSTTYSKYYSGDLSALAHQLKQGDGKHIYCDGGAELIDSLIQLEMIDEMIISIIPTVLCTGIPLFRKKHTMSMTLLQTKEFGTGLVQLHYSITYPKP